MGFITVSGSSFYVFTALLKFFLLPLSAVLTFLFILTYL